MHYSRNKSQLLNAIVNKCTTFKFDAYKGVPIETDPKSQSYLLSEN